jgi:gentisate 1,2-dioxygenase
MCTLLHGGGGRAGEGVGGKRPPSLPPMINFLTPPEHRERRDSHTFRPMREREAFYSQPMGRREYSHSGAAMDKLYTAYSLETYTYIQTRHSKL